MSVLTTFCCGTLKYALLDGFFVCFCSVLQSSLGNFVDLKLRMVWLFVKFLVGFARFLVV